MRTLLVTGFGPFLDVTDNPSGALARAVDGAVLPGLSPAVLPGFEDTVVRVVGRELPVSYARGPSEAVRLAWELGAIAVIGTGVAVSRPRVSVERFGRRLCGTGADVDGVVLASLAPAAAPDVVPSTWDVDALCAALDAEPSDDAGGYVCNAWLYRVSGALPGVPVTFVHLPADGLSPERLLRALSA